MGFFLSPKVDFNEIDLSMTVPAVATSIAAIVLRDTYKGIENTRLYTSNVDSLIGLVGETTDKSYIDLLSAVGYLKYGQNLYFSVVKPANATFATAVFTDNYGIVNTTVSGTTATALVSTDPDSDSGSGSGI